MAQDETALRAALDRQAGNWSGEVRVEAMDGFVLKTLQATRRATWEREVLVVETTLRDASGEYVVMARQAVRLGRLESTVRRPGQPEDRFLGDVQAGALVWTNAEGNRRDAREQVSERAGEFVLDTSSVEPMRALGLSGLVRLEGRFVRPVPQVAAVVPAVDASAVPANESLEAERRVVGELRIQLAAMEQRLAEADERGRDAAAGAGVLEQLRARLAEVVSERDALREDLEVMRRRETAAASEAGQRSALETQLAARDDELAAAMTERDAVRARLTAGEAAMAQQQRDHERLVAASAQLEQERTALAARVRDLEGRLAQPPAGNRNEAMPSDAGNPPEGQSGASVSREHLIAQLQQMERRVLEFESERNAAREQLALAQRQVEETRRLRDDTLLRFQAVVSELNALREEKDRLARANVSLQAEVRSAQVPSRSAVAGGTTPAGAASEAPPPATTFDGKTADMVIAALQIIGVTRGEDEDKVILDGRVHRNGDLVEAQLGITFLRIEGNALVFQDRRGREYRRRF